MYLEPFDDLKRPWNLEGAKAKNRVDIHSFQVYSFLHWIYIYIYIFGSHFFLGNFFRLSFGNLFGDFLVWWLSRSIFWNKCGDTVFMKRNSTPFDIYELISTKHSEAAFSLKVFFFFEILSISKARFWQHGFVLLIPHSISEEVAKFLNMQTSRRISELIVDTVARLDDFHLHRHFGHIMFFFWGFVWFWDVYHWLTVSLYTSYCIHPRKLTWNPKMNLWKRRSFSGSIFGFGSVSIDPIICWSWELNPRGGDIFVISPKTGWLLEGGW